ncbi:MAG: tRNA (adenosine(37)-N6)-dimethylallyltransferase MiaA [Actinomycetota bacterium]
MREIPLALVGPTASGKTEASLSIAEALDAEIVCIDSMLVYRGMDIGTAKPTLTQRERVRHHMLDIADPAETFSVATFQQQAREALSEIGARDRRALLVGGGGLYYRAVVDALEFPGTMPQTRALLEAEAVVLGPEAMYTRLVALDPDAARKIESGNARRTVRALEVAAITGKPFSAFARDWDVYPSESVRAAGVDVPRPILHRRIEERVQTMVPGLLEETRRLLDRGFRSFLTSSQAIGYAEAVACLEGGIGQDEMMAATIRRAKALARRQMAWFRRDPRIQWFPTEEDGAYGVVDQIMTYLREGRMGTPARSVATVEV